MKTQTASCLCITQLLVLLTDQIACGVRNRQTLNGSMSFAADDAAWVAVSLLIAQMSPFCGCSMFMQCVKLGQHVSCLCIPLCCDDRLLKMACCISAEELSLARFPVRGRRDACRDVMRPDLLSLV